MQRGKQSAQISLTFKWKSEDPRAGPPSTLPCSYLGSNARNMRVSKSHLTACSLPLDFVAQT